MNVGSPCIGVCRINVQSGLCAGCWRTMEEITAWPGMAESNRRHLLLVLEQRQATLAMPD
jgi:uncharacterized protein